MRLTLFSLVLATVLLGCSDPETRLRKKAARIHDAAVTVDSHTDTPLNLSDEEFDFSINNASVHPRFKVDLPRMKEGGMDGLWFAVFVGQRARTPEGHERARLEADEICDDIDSLVALLSSELEIATRADDLERISREGKHAIYLGMENGYPIGNDLELLNYYYDRGIRYVTIVHTGNNDICDSSIDTTEHGGLSPFGEKVIARMNDLGMMVDLSHASDDAFLDVIELSRAPVIASHSCARALCDNPRNLSDELLLKLKENGGVIQMCIYESYVVSKPQQDSVRDEIWKKYGNYYDLDKEGRQAFDAEWYAVEQDFPGEPVTVGDVADHIDHIVQLIGIDHVGIGTDFDGGGGLEGCYDISQMGNITLELVRRGYTAKEIEKIWGGNLTRVLREVEAASV